MNNNEYGLYEDIIGTLSTYFFVIDYWETAKPAHFTNKLHKFLCNEVSILRTAVNSFSIIIARLNEELNNKSPQEIAVIDSVLTNVIINIIPDSRIICKSTFTSTDSIRQQIKNCLAHSSFKIKETIENGKKQYYILFENEKIEGYMTLNDLRSIKDVYIAILTSTITSTNVIGGLKELIERRTSNLNVLKQSIDKIIVVENFSISDENDKDVYRSAEQKLMQEGRRLTEEEKEKIFYYIKFIGITNWASLSQSARKKIIDDNFHHLLENKIHVKNNEKYITYPFVNSFKALTPAMEQEYIKMHYESPFAYTSNLLELGYFCFNYIREAEKKEELDGFDYNDFKIKKINPQTFDGELAIKEVDEPTRYNNELQIKNIKKQKLVTEITSKTNELNGLRLSKVPEPKKTNLITQKQRQLTLLQKDYNNILQEIADLTEKLKSAKVYKDYKNLFRHLRNSFAHGFYKIDYVPGFKSGNLTDIMFTFEDFDVDKINNNKFKVFELRISAQTLYQLLIEFSKRIHNNLDQIQGRTLGVINSVNEGNKSMLEKSEEKIKNMEEKYGPVIKL